MSPEVITEIIEGVWVCVLTVCGAWVAVAWIKHRR